MQRCCNGVPGRGSGVEVPLEGPSAGMRRVGQKGSAPKSPKATQTAPTCLSSRVKAPEGERPFEMAQRATLESIKEANLEGIDP